MKRTTMSADQYSDSPAATTKARKLQMAAKAERLAEKKLEDGTASSQLIIYILSQASQKEELEKKQREADIALKQAKVDAIKSSSEIKDMFEEAMRMFKTYHGDEEDA